MQWLHATQKSNCINKIAVEVTFGEYRSDDATKAARMLSVVAILTLLSELPQGCLTIL